IIVPEAYNACSQEDVDAAAEVIRGADVVLCQLEIPMATVTYAAELAAAHQVRFILNPAPGQPLADSLMDKITILTPNEIEAEIVSGVSAHSPPATAHWEANVAKKLLGRGVGT